MNKKKRITEINITMMHETSGRGGGFSPVPPESPEPVPTLVRTYRHPDPTMLHETSGRDGFGTLSVKPDPPELLIEKYKGKFDRWLKNVPNSIEDDIKEYILSQLN